MIKVFCDICGKDTTDKYRDRDDKSIWQYGIFERDVFNAYQKYNDDNILTDKHERYLHLCDQCEKALNIWVDQERGKYK